MSSAVLGIVLGMKTGYSYREFKPLKGSAVHVFLSVSNFKAVTLHVSSSILDLYCRWSNKI